MKIVVVSSSASEEYLDLEQKAQALGHSCERVSVDDPNLESLDADVVYWRSAPITKEHPQAIARTALVQRLGKTVPILNEPLARGGSFTHKSYQQAVIERSFPESVSFGIPTFLASCQEALHTLVQTKKLAYPFIAKPDHGSQGKGVELIEDEEQLNALSKHGKYIYQNYIPNDCDYRIFVIGGVAVDVARRRATVASNKAYLNNVSQGGSVEPVDDIKLYEQLAKRAEKIAAAFNLAVCGVDLIQDSVTGQIYFMEINSVPQWVVFASALKADIGAAVVAMLVAQVERSTSNTHPARVVKSYYEHNLQALPVGKQFHYLSRQYLWSKNDSYKKQLDGLRSTWLPSTDSLIALAHKIPAMKPPTRSGGRPYRKEAYQEHFKIYSCNLIFFKLLFLQTVYEESVEEVLNAIDMSCIAAVRDKLLADEQALFTLSTHAVNFLYHYEHFFAEKIKPSRLLRIADEQSLPDSDDDNEARLYLYTHAIIGASRFYAQRPLIDAPHVYTEMLRRLEDTVLQQFPTISIDIKCEFLVCCKIVGYNSKLQEPILAELSHSYSPLGNYFVDTINSHTGKPYKAGLAASEHRNVLAIMAFDA